MLNMCLQNKIRVWDPLKLLYKNTENCNNYVLVVLNTPISVKGKESLLLRLWNKAYLRVTVDGGTFCWFSWLKANNVDSNFVKPPDFITGDLDSMSGEYLLKLKNRYSKLQIIKTVDQNETDFTKALRVIQQKVSEADIKVSTILTVVDSSGRIDQIMANINTLFKAKTIIPKCTVYLLGSDSLSWLLDEGFHSITIPPSLSRSKSWCSLVPIGCSSVVTTTGLKWNLTNTLLEFGNLVSTSNTYSGEPSVSVLNNSPILWSMSILSIATNPDEKETEEQIYR